ncbi:MAG: 3-hydroxyacyl-CoA dehydrogenase NAD-binding domain-containing protein [Hyphomicrobiales bacterium]
MTDHPVVHIEREAGIAVILVDNPPVNALGAAVRAGLVAAIAEIAADETIVAAVLACAGRTFIAGADIREFGKPPVEPLLPDVVAAIETSPKPVAAAIHGTALGGGLEIALGCHYRVMSADAKVGLPEVTLGIIPGAGGTQRLPRLVGFAAALDVVTSGRKLGSSEAVELGLADLVVADDVVGAAVSFMRERAEEGGPHPRTAELPVPEFDAAAYDKAATAVARKARGQLSPLRAAEAIRNVATMDFADGMRREREIFRELVASDQAAALRYAFFAEREVGKVPGLEGVEPRPVDRIAIVGAGTMGSGIAIACLDAGFEVTIIETGAEALEKGRGRVTGTYDGMVSRGRIDAATRDARLGRATFAVGLEAASGASLVIEAVFEDMALKRDVFARLDEIMPAGAVLATNTSYLDVDEIARATSRPEAVVGLHFFSPANIMKLLEVVRGAATAPDVLATAMAVARRLGKVAVVSGVCDGFIGNRILATYRKQADFLIEEGALPEEIDAAMLEYGYPMGPYAVADLAGLDISWANRKRLAATRDPRERYVKVADRLCEMGRFGRKTGSGWYDYAGDSRGRPDPVVREVIETASAEAGVTRRAIGADEIRARILAAVVNEAAKVLAEGIAARALDIDMVMVNGYGYPRWRGGPLFEADRRGLKVVLEEVRAACAAGGYGWEPAPLLVDLAEKGGTFADYSAGVRL